MLYRVITAVVSCLFIVLYPYIASADTQIRNVVGWYFDSQATQRCLDSAPFQVVTAYLCINNATEEWVSGWELEAEISGNAYCARWELFGNALNLRNPPEFIVGLGGVANYLPFIDNKVILCELDLLLLDVNPVELYTKPVDGGTVPNEMIYMSDVGIVTTIVPSSGSITSPSAWINTQAWPCVSNNRSNEYKIYVKTLEGAIDIINSSGGDLVGNITINSNSLDSLITEFGVEEIQKITAGFPDSSAYYVRVTNETRVSTALKDLYIFTFSDTTNCRLFAESDSSCSSILWTTRPEHASCDYDPDDTYLGYHISNEYGLSMNVLKAWDYIRSGTVPVAVIDSGIEDDKDNLDFYGRVIGDMGYYYQLENYSHGTMVGGLIGAVQDNDYGTTGMCQVKLYNVKYHWDNDDQLDFTQALQRLMNTQIAIANFSGGWQSFGGNIFDAETGVRNICDEFYNSNRMLFAAAGNNGISPTKSPARYSSVYCISGINRFGDQYDMSNYGKVDFTAPAENVRVSTTIREGQNLFENTMIVNGTSFSTPIAAGTAALLLSYNPNLYNDDVYNLLKLSARVDLLSEPQQGTLVQAYGHGLIQAWEALELLLTNAMVSSKEYGYSRYTETYLGTRTVYNVPRIGDGRYFVYRYKIEKDVMYPRPFDQMPYVWGRGVDTSGIAYLNSNPMEVTHKRNCDVLSGSESVNGCTLVTYVYKFVNIFDHSESWYPSNLNNLYFGYAALGKDGIVSIGEEHGNIDNISIAPNPFNISTVVSLFNETPVNVSIIVYDVMGHVVRILHNGMLAEGWHTILWDGRDEEGGICASAVYLMKSTTDGKTVTKALTLIK